MTNNNCTMKEIGALTDALGELMIESAEFRKHGNNAFTLDQAIGRANVAFFSSPMQKGLRASENGTSACQREPSGDTGRAGFDAWFSKYMRDEYLMACRHALRGWEAAIAELRCAGNTTVSERAAP